MQDWIISALRQLALKLVGGAAIWLTAWFAAHGLDIPIPPAVVNGTVVAIVAGGLLVWTVIVRWLESRPGNGLPARAARRLARWLMLGIAVKPVYLGPGDRAQADSQTGAIARR